MPTDSFPDWLRALSRWTPTHRFAELGWSVTEGHAPHLITALTLAGWLALFAGYALRSYRVCTRTA